MTPRQYKILVNLEDGFHWTWIFLPPVVFFADSGWVPVTCACGLSVACFFMEIWLEEILERESKK